MATPKPSEKPSVITVQSGDTLGQIALDYLGSVSKYTQLAAINNITNPNRIYIGQKIKLTKDGSSTTSTKKANSNAPTVTEFGVLSNADDTLYAAWAWDKKNTDKYSIIWTYETGDGVWFAGSGNGTQTNTVDPLAPALSRQSTYQIPSNAKTVKFKVKPIAKEKKTTDKNGKETSTPYWTADWSTTKKWTDSTPLATPGSAPGVEIEKYKLTASLDNIDITGATHIQFEVVKDNAASYYSRKTAKITSGHASYSWTVPAGAEYKVRCRAYKNANTVSEWTNYSSNVKTIPATPKGIKTCRASSETSVYLEWYASPTATKYDVEYAEKKEYFDYSDQTKRVSDVEFTKWDISGLESGHEYFFRVRAKNEANGESGWCEPKSVLLGDEPAAPTTWSSSTTVITGEKLTLYWVHNSRDESSQTFAQIELTIGGTTTTHEVKNPYIDDENEADKTLSYDIDTTSYLEGTTIEWRVRTAGVTKIYGDWSIQRTVNIYAPPTLELKVTDNDANVIETLTSFPFYISGLAGPNTQAPIGYHVTITPNELYETTDAMGNPVTVNAGEQIYSKYFDITEPLLIEMSAGNVDLQNNITYTVTCVVSMNSGLTSEATAEFTVEWTDEVYSPNLEITLDEETYTTYIRPYCEDITITTYLVDNSSGEYVVSPTEIDSVYGEPVQNGFTTTGEQVYLGVTGDDEEVYYCMVETADLVEDITLSVYRREFDGSFTELATDIENLKYTTITDPHPALDLARYRVVATSKSTGAVSFYDPPGFPVNCKSVIIQWDEDWSSFDTYEDAIPEQPAWSGSLLNLPYNIDIRDDHNPDVAYVNYIGRKRPVSYYGTQLGETATWDVEIAKSDKDTLYALRRLAVYNGDVYIREPSGSGYWASITVSFSQTHKELTIPVTLDITRVEGGI